MLVLEVYAQSDEIKKHVRRRRKLLSNDFIRLCTLVCVMCVLSKINTDINRLRDSLSLAALMC